MRFKRNDQGNAVVGVLLVILALIAAVVLGIGMWQFHWFMAAKNMDKQTDITRRSLQYQTARVDEIRQAIQNFNVADANPTSANKALAKNALSTICADYGELHGTVPSDVAEFVASHPCN